MMSTIHFVTATAILGVASASSANITISVADVNFGKQNLNTPFPGASTAFSTSFLNYVVGTGAGNNRYKRPIIPFLRSSFDSVAGLALTSATLHFAITNNHTELGESFESEVRLFTTAETELSNANANVFAGLTGDGGDHAVVGTYLFSTIWQGFSHSISRLSPLTRSSMPSMGPTRRSVLRSGSSSGMTWTSSCSASRRVS